MSNEKYIAIAGILAGAAYLLSAKNVNAEQQGSNTSGSAVNSGTGFAINNPGNLRYIATDPYNGQVGNSEGFGIYDTLANGVRAMGKQLTHDYQRGQRTITTIIAGIKPGDGLGYSPASENNTTAYIASVSGTTSGNPYAMNISPTENLEWPDDQLDLVMAIIWQENGKNPLAESDVQTWLQS